MPAYDGLNYDPPAPVAQVIARPSNEKAGVEITLLLDTGADVTLLPSHAITQLGIAPVAGADYELVGFDGSKSVARSAELDLVFEKRIYRGRYLVVDGVQGVLGRDVLCSVRLLLDGPQQAWSVMREG